MVPVQIVLQAEPGEPGPQGAEGPAGLSPPSVRHLAQQVMVAALSVSPRTVLDPRACIRYWTTLASRVLALQGGLFLRTVGAGHLPDAAGTEETPDDHVHARSIV